MGKSKRLYIKLGIIVIGILILILIVLGKLRNPSLRSTQKEYIPISDVKVLVTALKTSEKGKVEKILGVDSEYLSYEKYLTLIQYLDSDGQLTDITDEEYANTNAYIEKEKWYDVYDELLTHYDKENIIQKKIITILAKGKAVEREDGSILDENTLFSLDGIEYKDEYQLCSSYSNQPIQVYVCGEQLLTVRNNNLDTKKGQDSVADEENTLYEKNDEYTFEKEDKITLFNVWVKSTDEKEVCFLYKQHLICVPGIGEAEQVADIQIKDGKIINSKVKSEKISGKVIRIDEDSKRLVLEGKEEISISSKVNTYQIHGVLQEKTMGDIVIGYQFTDFVVEDGEICAALITRDGAMENIRVLLCNSDYEGTYHDTVTLTADSDYMVTYKEETKDYKASEVLQIEELELHNGDRIYVKPSTLSAKICISSIKRAIGVPEYRGTLEIEKREEGYLIINELLLEEYLYAVVPSEMPASYPEEALQAQAICARTYAYKAMLHAGLSGYGAHVDDSTSYQVYHNINEETTTTDAVNATKGEILRFGEELVGAYYYSTSCGYGTNACVWSGNEASDYPYLKAKHISDDNKDKNENLISEEEFKAYITSANESDFESGEGWYRWNYTIEKLNKNDLLERLKNRYQCNPDLILTKTDEDTFESKNIEDIGDICDIYVISRNEGGVINELMIQGSKYSVKVVTEYNVRYVLSDGKTKVRKQDQSESGPSMLLPSAFAIVQPSIDKNVVVGYSVIGGGYGHGVGMSQNAAKDMAVAGYSSDDIVDFFYEGSHVAAIY